MPVQRARPKREKSDQDVATKLPAPLAVSWREAQRMPVAAANAFQVGLVSTDGGPGEVVLGFGFLPPIPVWGTREQQLEMVANLGGVEVQPVARITLSGARLKELHQMLGQLVTVFEAAK
ncbi:MAG: hypothetical protein M0027_08460 [Candidatus Dormibacteraeota bacterium]|jgi:hypothetical protein|nr:hypothetical protein [Candidatus Dormibacteraeota bacterium]